MKKAASTEFILFLIKVLEKHFEERKFKIKIRNSKT